jgi:hypothetical protein
MKAAAHVGSICVKNYFGINQLLKIPAEIN